MAARVRWKVQVGERITSEMVKNSSGRPKPKIFQTCLFLNEDLARKFFMDYILMKDERIALIATRGDEPPLAIEVRMKVNDPPQMGYEDLFLADKC